MKNDWGSLPNIIGSTGFVIGDCPEVVQPHKRFQRKQIALFAALAAPVVSVFFASPSLAQVPRPDAGQILRETPPPPPPAPGEARSFAPEDRSAGRAKTFEAGRIVQFEFMLKGFLFTGNERIGEEELRREVPAIEALQGKRVGLADLEAVAEAITRYYRSRGYLVAIAYVPPQDVVNGIATVAINVLEGKVDRGRIGESAGYAPDVLQRFLDQSLCGRATPDCAGVPMQRAPIDRAIGIIADLPGVNSVGGTLSPGGPIGTSDLTLDATADPDRVWTIGVDNFGNRYIGRDRVSTGVRMNNPTGIGDRLIADLITSGRGMSNGYLEYSLPIGYAGWRTGLSATHSVYKLGAPFDLTDSHGKADILSPYLAYPLIRSQDKNLYFRGSYSAKWLEDDVLDSAFKKREHAFSLGLNGDTVDGLLGGGANGYALSYGRGRITLAGTASPAGVPNNSGDFDKINYSLWRDQTLGYFNSSTTRLSLYGALRGQSANRNLDSVEKFTLGGPGGVRAYPVGEAIGDEGKLATLELRYSTSVTAFGGSNLTLALFRDQGWLTVNHRPWAGYTGPATRQLHGNGVGIEFSRRNAFAWKLVWAVRDRGGELPTSDDTNRNRFWLQGSLIF